MRVVSKKSDKSALKNNSESTSSRAMWKFMLKSISYGTSDRKIYDSSSSFFGLPLGQVSADEEQLPTPVQVRRFLCLLFYFVVKCFGGLTSPTFCINCF